ncbi:tannase/feruloyl esterase family alpha/beta hydrolase [uncultured Cardiobacterium sp.]|uniref:tannase/feruloyl esterase family alpha/beta hydrolase n=1 Tax=uncultured Cardiobacterium sp. TaxID=417619 RepID=UPI0034219580
MTKTLPALAVAAVALTAQADEKNCLALQQTTLPDTVINSVTWSDGAIDGDNMAALTGGSAAAQKARPHCVVSGEIGARTGADGKHYGIKFQLRLPENWNQRFLFQGGGGVDGFVAPAVGNIPVRSSTATPALMRGYAVVSMDGGHPTPTPDFGADQQARLDFAYQATGKVTTVAKALIRQHYQQAPKHSTFMGCSNGGREALIAAQRYPLEFDGVIAANPGFRLSRAAVAQQWDYQQLMKIAPTNDKGEKILANALTQEDLDKVSAAVLKQCDSKDGRADGIINAWENCDFQPDSLDLPQAKIAALKAVMDGAHDSKGNPIYSGWYYDTGLNQPDWRAWKLGTSQTGKADARNVSLGAGSLLWYFMTPAVPDFNLEKFDFDRDPLKTYQTGALNDAISTDLSSFKAGGGKLIVVTGVSDPVFSAKDQVAWYKTLQQDTADAASFSRLFMVPGMNHCGGGQAYDDFDPLTALENWQDKGEAPNALTARGKAFPNQEMPLCAYPQVTMYKDGSYRCE